MSPARSTPTTGPARPASKVRRRGSSFAAPGAPSGRATAASWHHQRGTPDFSEELVLHRRGHRFVAGIDEVGRGCLAGPVVAAAVILPEGWMPDGLRDSKLLKVEDRERVAAEVRQHALAWSIAFVEPAVIDRINILQATLLAAATAAGRLSIRPDALLLDGSLILHDLSIAQRVVIDGDRLCASVAAASVVAKVARDRLMVELDLAYPGYGLASNKGYAAPDHRAALAELGLTPIHRRTFASCADVEQLGIWAAAEGLPPDGRDLVTDDAAATSADAAATTHGIDADGTPESDAVGPESDGGILVPGFGEPGANGG